MTTDPLPWMIAYKCPYCEFYGDQYVGNFGTVRTHAQSHPITVEPVPNERVTP